jgi:hypothetical protein
MIKDNVVIFGYPRSGTKLLANVLEQQEYFNFGEFFETFSTEFKDDSHVATRLSREDQFALFRSFRSVNSNIHEVVHKHSILLAERVNSFQKINVPNKTTLTIFGDTIDIYPELLDILRTRYFLCTRRKNILEQLLSNLLTYKFKNYNGEESSEQMIINLDQMHKWFFNLKKTERIQNYLVSTGRGIIIDFDQLITGTLDLGFKYKVTSIDQHENIENFIINYDEVIEKFNYLNSLY